MIQDDRYRFDAVTPSGVKGRLESDAESLPFPVGGVFGPITPGETPTNDDWDTMDTVSAIEHVINRMQTQLDSLESGVEDVIAHIGGDGDGWHPSAA